MTQQLENRFFLVGGAGFLGSHFTDHLLADVSTEQLTIYDNFSSGRAWHYAHHRGNPKLSVIRGDVKDTDLLRQSMAGHQVVIHFASNPDIARAATEPDIDFREGTFLTHCVLEAMKTTGASRILYTSGSGIYGDLGNEEAHENWGPLLPISTYGASKLAGEALISSYCFMFGLTGCIFRFGNVVGPRQTHGVGLDFARRLLNNPSELTILGDGSQSKSYIHAEDVVRAVLCAHKTARRPLDTFNVATGDYITVKEIADIAVKAVGLDPANVKYAYTGGDRGWKGDVPIVRLNTDKIRSLGWKNYRGSAPAIHDSILSMLVDMREGRIQ